jgi:hypothetical protein
MDNSDEQESSAEIKLHRELQELAIGAFDRTIRLGARSNSTLSTNSKNHSWSRRKKAPAKKGGKEITWEVN